MMQNRRNPSRIRPKDLDQAIFTPNTEVDRGEQNPISGVLVFTLLGKNDGRVDENWELSDTGYPVLSDKDDTPAEELDIAYAKMVQTSRATKYFVKRYVDGRLFNPVDKYVEHKHSKDVHVRGDNWKWAEVTKNIFIHYLKFLTTRNQAWITTAQRELI